MVSEQVTRAKQYYVISDPLDELITSSCRPALWAMTTIYRGLLDRIERAPQRIVGNRRLRLSGLHKGMIAVRAKWQASRNGADD